MQPSRRRPGLDWATAMRIVEAVVLILACQQMVLADDESLRVRAAGGLIDEFATRVLRETGTPGLAIVVTSRNGVLWESFHGFANLEGRTPITAETLFGIGSIGKSFTAVSILKLHDQGKVDTSAPVSQYLPWFRANSTAPITVHHLLTHTAGLPAMRMELMSSLYQVFWLRDAPYQFEPGQRYYYSSAAFDVLSSLIEAVAHRPYGDFVKENVLAPLEMAHSEPVFVSRMRPRLATSYERLYDDRPARPEDPLVPSNWYEYGGGAGSVAATARDLSAYVRMILNRGKASHGRILSDESFNLLIQHAVKLSPDHYYGYAIRITDADGHTRIGHGGSVQGFRSIILADLEAGVGVAALTNGPAALDTVAELAVSAVAAAIGNHALPRLPAAGSITAVRAADYAGEYSGAGGRKILVRADGGHLALEHSGKWVPLLPAGEDAFLASDPEFALFPLRFHRENGGVVEAYYGADWYTNQRYAGPREFEYPHEWDAYPGHYRTATRQHVNFRIVLRKGKLWFVNAAGDETALVADRATFFRIADTPEWLQFGEVLAGKALRVNYSGTDYHRDFTP